MPGPGVAKPLKHFYEVPRDLLSRTGIEVRQHPKGLTGTLIVGDNTGLIKVVSCKKRKVVKLWGQQNPVKRINRLYWAHAVDNNPQKEFLAVLSNGDVRLYNALCGSYTTPIKQETDIQGLYVMENPCLTEKDKRMIWTVNEKGDMRLWGLDYNKKTYLDKYCDQEIQFPTDTMILNKLPNDREKIKLKKQKNKKDKNSFLNLLSAQTKNTDKTKKRGILLSAFNVNTLLKKEKLESRGESTANVNNKRKLEVIRNKRKNKKKIFTKTYGYNRGKIRCLKGHYSPSQFPWIAIAGNDRPVEIYDFNKQKCIFRGEHHYHWLGHKHEIIVNDIDWSKKTINPYLCAAVTSQSELKLYDVRAKKSMFAQKIGDYSLNRVRIKSKKKILIGDSNSNLWEFDYLKKSKERGYVYRRYRGFIGAITDFDMHPTRNLVASVCLGRYAIIHRFNQPHLPMAKIYLKQKLTSILFSSCYDTKYLPTEEKENEQQQEQKEDVNGDDVDSFLNEDEDEDEDVDEEEEEDDDIKEEEDNLMMNKLNDDWKDKLDGYDTDELKELLNELKNEQNNGDSDKEMSPPLKKRKLQ